MLKHILHRQKRSTLQNSGLKDFAYNRKALRQLPLSIFPPTATPGNTLEE